jgi:8-oxo-dGTP pyrophosphatase MutT (NUDIX family)
VDEGEDPLDAAKRETAEELGMEFSSWKLIKVTQPFEKRNGLSIPMYVGIFQKIYRLTTIVASRLIRWK